MRIVGGRWRGRPLVAPEGRGTRPTQDRVREAMASMVASALGLDLSGARILDPFAGSGALSLELLSRGAAHALLVERDPRAIAAIQRNVATLGARGSVTLARGDAYALGRRRSIEGGPFSVVLLDPPYAIDGVSLVGLLRQLGEQGALAPGAVVLHERAREAPGLPAAPLAALGLERGASRAYGSTALDLWVPRTAAAAPIPDPSAPRSRKGSPMDDNGIRHVVVPGSFDPITLGHVDVIARARRLSPQVTVAVAASEGKRGVGTSFTLEERIALARESLAEAGLGDVAVVGLHGLLVDLCRELGAQAVVKGLRAATDFEYELQQAAVNQSLAPDIESIFVMSRPDFSYLSSSLVREISALGGDVSDFVPPCVAARLSERRSSQGAGGPKAAASGDSC